MNKIPAWLVFVLFTAGSAWGTLVTNRMMKVDVLDARITLIEEKMDIQLSSIESKINLLLQSHELKGK